MKISTYLLEGEIFTMLQERINEMDSGILTIDGTRVHIIGFSNEKMLMGYLTRNKKNWSSIGLYDYQDLSFNSIKNNALFIVKKNGEEIGKYQYVPVYKGTVKYIDNDEKTTSMTFTIRKSTYSPHYHFLSEKISRIFETKQAVIDYLQDDFKAKMDF